MSAKRRERTDGNQEYVTEVTIETKNCANAHTENAGHVATVPDRLDSLSDQNIEELLHRRLPCMGSITVDHFNRGTSLGLLRLADVLFPNDYSARSEQCKQKSRGRDKKKPDER